MPSKYFSDAFTQGGDVIVYDLEYFGDIEEGPQSCRIWEIYAVNLRTLANFHELVTWSRLAIEKAPIPQGVEIPQVTSDFLRGQGARKSIGCVMWHFFEWIHMQGTCPTLVSHGGNSSDVLVLQSTIRSRTNLAFPRCLFMDSLMYIRDNFHFQGGYSLQNLSIQMHIPHNEIHRARGDTETLCAILATLVRTVPLCGVAHPLTVNSLRYIKGVGRSWEGHLLYCGVTNVQDLIQEGTVSPHLPTYMHRNLWHCIESCNVAI